MIERRTFGILAFMVRLKQDKARGGRITMARELREFTQEELALEMLRRMRSQGSNTGISRGAVGNWERGGGIRSENLNLLAEVLDVSPEWLLQGRGRGPGSIEGQPAFGALPDDTTEAALILMEYLLGGKTAETTAAQKARIVRRMSELIDDVKRGEV